MKTFFTAALLFFISLAHAQNFTLEDFYSDNAILVNKTNQYFNQLNDTTRVGQMIVPATGRLGKNRKYVSELATKGWIGVILLLNGTVDVFTQDVHNFDSIMKVNGHLPLLYSADAEPTLVNRKIANSRPVPKTNQIHHIDSVKKVTTIISEDFLDILKLFLFYFSLSKINIFFNFSNPHCRWNR